MDKLDDMEVDISAYEHARYQAIKDSGEYVELSILISGNNDDANSDLPCVRTEMREANPEMVGKLYTSVKMYLDHLRKEYPMECLLAEFSHEAVTIGQVECPLDDDEEQPVKKKRGRKKKGE